MSTQYNTGETTQQYWDQIQADIPATVGLQQAGNLSVNGTLTGFSAAGNAYAARMKFLAQASIVAAVPQVPSSGVVVAAMSPGGTPDNSTTPNTQSLSETYSHPEGDASKNNNGIYNWTPERYMA